MDERGEMAKQDCWKLMTFGERILTFLLFITVSLFLALFVLIVYLQIHGRHLCESPICIKSASRLLSSLDINTPPCQNFTQFACGQNAINQHAASDSQLEQLEIVSGAWSEQDSGKVLVLKRFYQACTNISAIEQNGDAMLMRILDEIGGWPLLLGENWQYDKVFNWLEYMVLLRNAGLKFDFFINLGYYPNENGTNLLMIGPPTNIKQIKNNLKLVYYQTMVNVAIKLGSSTEFAWQELRKVCDFEHELSIIVDRAQNRSFFDQKGNFIQITLDELNSFFPNVNLPNVFNKLAKDQVEFSKDSEIVLAVESYIYELNTLLQKTAKRTQANFLIWKIIEGYLPFSRDAIRKDYEEYSEIDSRDDYCFKELQARFGGVLEAEYLSNYLNEELTQSLKLMVNLIKANIINGAYASPESEVVITGIEDENIEEFKMEFDTNNILQMLNEVHFRNTNLFFACLYRNASWCEQNDFQQNAQNTDGYFDVIQNTLILPAKYLLPEWYSLGQPNYLNYAQVGRVIGNVFKETLNRLQMNENGTAIKSGSDLAFQGYLRFIQLNGIEKNLPGLNFTNRQLFWIQSAQIFCGYTNNTEYFEEIANSEYFKQEFQCL